MLFSKFLILKDFCSSDLLFSEIKDPRTDKTYKRYIFNTIYTDCFRFYGQRFYKKKGDIWKKQIPKDIKKYL